MKHPPHTLTHFLLGGNEFTVREGKTSVTTSNEVGGVVSKLLKLTQERKYVFLSLMADVWIGNENRRIMCIGRKESRHDFQSFVSPSPFPI